MKLKHHLTDFWDKVIPYREPLVKQIDRGILLTLTFAFLLVMYQIIFPKSQGLHLGILSILYFVPVLAGVLYVTKWFLSVVLRIKSRIFDRTHLSELIFGIILFTYEYLLKFFPLLSSEWFLYIILGLYFTVRILREGTVLNNKRVTPSILFVISFLMLILLGTAILLMPHISTRQISFLDAFFTATSAVCVTGLTVVDTPTTFTTEGEVFLMLLIQIGGLGLMTFTNFFAILFRGGMSFRNNLILSDLIQTDKPNSLFATLVKIIIYTLVIEFLGVLLIHWNTDTSFFQNEGDSWFFAVFHSVSAFCNAGFSTLPDGLFNTGFRFNYEFQLVICFLVILGGIGFPVVIDLYQSFKNVLTSFLRWFLIKEPLQYQARNYNVHTRLVLSSTFVLLLVGMILYYLTEHKYSLREHPTTYGKFVQTFFGSVTPRTAGFNTIDMGKLAQGTLLFYLLLMWIGASPSSTGGGIKTTTFVIAISNIVSLARGKNRIDLFKREITDGSIKRAFAVIFLSLLTIGSGIFLISIFEPEQDLSEIAFECFSAYSTVGLSMNLTPQLGDYSKMVLILMMFLGRVGMFTILFGLFKKTNTHTHKYPSESVMIM